MPGEIEREALDVASICSTNAYQKKFFNCQCLGNEFLRFRKEQGPSAALPDIYDMIVNSRHVNPSCVETEQIARNATKSCGGFVRDYSNAPADMRNDDGDYCTCVGNKLALDFTAVPRLSSSYIEKLRRRALTECRKPEVRQQVSANAQAQ